MLDILLKNKEIQRLEHIEHLHSDDFYLMQIIGYNAEKVEMIEQKYHIDASIIKHFQDIEISSHFLASPSQISFHISLPFYNENKDLEERPLFFILTQEHFFLFIDEDIDAYINQFYTQKIPKLQQAQSLQDIFDLQIEFISDYYADITENEIRKVKTLANRILEKEKFTNNTLNMIAKHSFNNLLIKEMLIETRRVFALYEKNMEKTSIDIHKEIMREIRDLSVVSDYIQFNNERLKTLKETVARKIDVEQNYIFKILTITTLCIAFPTMIAGIYGMNFEHMPELSSPYGYPIALAVMLLSAILPFIFFKVKKWL